MKPEYTSSLPASPLPYGFKRLGLALCYMLIQVTVVLLLIKLIYLYYKFPFYTTRLCRWLDQSTFLQTGRAAKVFNKVLFSFASCFFLSGSRLCSPSTSLPGFSPSLSVCFPGSALLRRERTALLIGEAAPMSKFTGEH